MESAYRGIIGGMIAALVVGLVAVIGLVNWLTRNEPAPDEEDRQAFQP